MKRISLALLIFCLIIQQAFSSQLYLAPNNSITNINMNSPAWSDEKAQEDYNNIRDDEDLFAPNQYVVTGALYGVKESSDWFGDSDEDKEKRYGIEVSVSSDSWDGKYFWFTSQSNPDSKRPFILQATFQNRDFGYARNVSHNREVYTLNGGDSFASYYFYDRDDWLVLRNRALLFDIAIVLPGTINNGVLTLDDGRTYPIASADDYSADLSVILRLVKRNGETNNPDGWTGPEDLSFSFPISGFYDPTIDSPGTITEANSSLNIHMLPKAANIDLQLDQGQSKLIPIADLSYAVYNIKGNAEDVQISDDDIFLFLSASSNPFTKNSRGFEFVHEDVTSEEQKNNQNTIGFDITAIATDESGQNIKFDGTDFLSGDGSVNNPAKKITTTHHDDTIQHMDPPSYRHWHSYDGTLYLTLDDRSMMDAGYYKGYVYVHAIVNGDNVGGSV
ncbi:MAG: hypothetical protein IAA97_07095 [Spirochaetes bacterium]|uniref:Uncharacterized protein n=1 Tax=Candidatus Ornithospirochaeta stercoripullorum TaxID=2840899 RepID=A0A9D9E071_9SPIO|nr:hypothetical protein [Candidatus Ornithospirochaeta stercoripullorum]